MKGRTKKCRAKKKTPWQKNNTRAAMGLIFFLSAIFLLFTSLLGDKSLFQLHKLELQKEWWTQENARQVQENASLRQKILAARDDLFIVEKIAREDLGMVKENERVYLFNHGEILKVENPIPGIR